MPTECKAAGASDRGRVRLANEDTYGLRIHEGGGSGDFVVCDGMGGAAAGEIASRIAAETMLEEMGSGSLTAERMQQAVSHANWDVYARAEADPALAGMGTTLIALALRGSRAWLAHVGDSRCYRLRDGEFQRLTQDHSLVGEQVRLGQLTPVQAAVSPYRNVITRAVGTEACVAADIMEMEVAPGDMYLLASDGLTRELADDSIAAILLATPERAAPGRTCSALCAELIAAANRAGGRDNIACVLVRIQERISYCYAPPGSEKCGFS